MKLPIGIQTFEQIIQEDYIYIDKTKEAYELINSYKYVFLSRPRRFGKSLFLDTLKNIFEGKKQYFKGLYIEDKYNFDDIYPVIKIDFAGDLKSQKDLDQTIQVILQSNQERLGVTCDKELNAPNCFLKLIEQTYNKYNKQLVILIDEYDKPILDNITDKSMATYARDALKALYEIMKKSDKYIKFVFITGVSKFAKVSVFSGLNNLEDITLNPNFGNICGYTQDDIETSFKPLLNGVDLEELKLWYNGYNFLKDKIYNPFDILLFIRNDKQYDNYWFDTGTPTFLINLIKQNNYFLPNLENIILDKNSLNSFDIDNIDLEIILYQAGYLTIREENKDFDGNIEYILKVPNKEVKVSLYKHIIKLLFKDDILSKNRKNIFYSLQSAKLDDFKTVLTSLFASIPYQNYTNNTISHYEGYYASMIYVYIASLGLEVDVEDSTNQGRVDMSILINSNRYIFEFKTDDNSKDALTQIKENKYYEKYQSENSKIYLVGINFNKEKRNISKFAWEEWGS